MSEKNNAKKKLNRQQTSSLIPAIKTFNKMAKVFINILNKKIKEKEDKINNIRVLVQDLPISAVQNHHNISIKTLDINETMVKVKGGAYKKQKMAWESDLRSRNKGIIL